MSNRPGPFAQCIAAEIRAELARQQQSKRWLAEQIGEPHVTVTRWVNGDGPMSFDSMDVICEALGVSVVDILKRAEQGKESALATPRPPRTRRSRAVVAEAGVAADSTQETGLHSHRFDDTLVAA